MSATACAVVPPMPASISSNTIVSPPATAAIASAMRESSPPEAVSATGPNGSPAFGRIRNRTSSAPVAPGSRSASSTWNSPSPRPMPCELGGDRRGERLCRGRAGRAQLGVDAASTAASARRGPASAACTGSWPSVERRQLLARRCRALEQLRVASARGSAASRSASRSSSRLDLLEPARDRPRARRGSRAARTRSRAAAARPAAARRRPPPSSGASRSSGATARSAAATRSVAPSPSSGASAAAAPAAACASSVTWRSRSRSARSSSSRPSSRPSCPRRARAARRAAPRPRRRRCVSSS